jgi:predicted dehydrogenase
MYRFHPRTEKVLELVRSGVVGELRMIHSAFTFRVTRPENIRLNPELGGGALMDVGSYCVNISRTAAGCEPVEVQAVARWGASGVDEQLLGTLRFPTGVLAQFDCALALERREDYLLAGTEASLGVSAAFLPGKAAVKIFEVRGRNEEKEHIVYGADEYQLMVEHFSDCILNDQSLRYPAVEAAANMRVIDALYRSARSGGVPQNVA